MSNSEFYRAFENQFRGSRNLIKSRLEVYLPFVKPLLDLVDGNDKRMLDLGCGRGEWLELMNQLGADARGADIDAAMLEGCAELGLDVEVKDALLALADTASESLLVVSAFHVAEHLEFTKLHELIRHAYRVLVPGGLLILETPNPENPVVASVGFNLDPTHRKPLPPPLLGFLVSYCGFDRYRDIRLQQAKEFTADQAVSLFDVFSSSSQDYAIVAQKPGPARLLSALDQPFSSLHGVSLQDVANLYDASVERRFGQQEKHVETSNAHITVLGHQLDQYAESLPQLQAQHESGISRLEAKLSALLDKQIEKMTEQTTRLDKELNDRSARQAKELMALKQCQTTDADRLKQALLQQQHNADSAHAAVQNKLNELHATVLDLQSKLHRLDAQFDSFQKNPIHRLVSRLSRKREISNDDDSRS